ncbi:hypothetical protein CHS0354_027858 [Potamilus streckersoni]|uniref:Uncharacterized protein n=1 Tax=Potamilus streckersoni TaxID=2493646 RepID=A0AAE0T0L9_9BIVA|nr:hypothetical protein CHS0354_027858 [Potamilus streckersoni]
MDAVSDAGLALHDMVQTGMDSPSMNWKYIVMQLQAILAQFQTDRPMLPFVG